jgi:hypothetical protein
MVEVNKLVTNKLDYQIMENINENEKARQSCKTDVSGSTWFKTEQIETAVNVNGDMTADEIKACRKKLIVLHECGEDKKALIEQLETMIL